MINYNEDNNKIIEEMSLLNSQLHNLTRELSKKNLELEKAHKKITDDMEKAHKLHRMFLPEKNLEVEGFSFATYYKPAQKLGGDFYNIIKIKNKVLFYLVDVSGHGLDGTILTIFIRETINKYLLFNQLENKEPLSPSGILKYLAIQYCQEHFPLDYFVCVIAAILDLDKKTLCLSNAGFQTEPFLVHPEGRISRVSITGPPVSSVISQELYDFNETTIPLPHQASILFTTDGLIEEMKMGEMYGETRLAKILKQGHSKEPHLLKDLIVEDFEDFAGKSQGSDDISFLIIKRK